MFRDHETNCLIPIRPNSRCFVVMKRNISSRFKMFQGVSRRRNKLFHCWFVLIQPVSSLFDRSDSSCFMLIQTVSALFHQCFISGNEPLLQSVMVQAVDAVKTKLTHIRCVEKSSSIFKEANYAKSSDLEEINATRIRRPRVQLNGPAPSHQTANAEECFKKGYYEVIDAADWALPFWR